MTLMAPLLHSQMLRLARTRVAKGALLPSTDEDNRHGTRFWEAVAGHLPGRTPADCLDAFLASQQNAVARFTARRPSAI